MIGRIMLYAGAVGASIWLWWWLIAGAPVIVGASLVWMSIVGGALISLEDS